MWVSFCCIAMATKLIHKNSKVQFKNATGAQLEFAELGLNYHSSGPYLQAKVRTERFIH